MEVGELGWRRSMCEGAGVNYARELGAIRGAPEEVRAGSRVLDAGAKHCHPQAPVLPQTAVAMLMYSCQG